MSGKPQLPWPEPAQVLEVAKRAKSMDELAEILTGDIGERVTRSGLQSFCTRHGIHRSIAAELAANRQPDRGPAVDTPGVHEHTDGSATVVSEARNQPPAPWKPDELLKVHGLDPAEWEVVRVRGNRWGDPAEPMHQLRVDVIPRRLLLAIPDPANWTPPPKPKVATKDRKRQLSDPRKIVVCGDHHAPHEDRTLHALFLQWLSDERPDEGVILGDLMDFSSISRHREREGFSQPVNEGLRAALMILMDYRHASPDTRWTLLRGNHDDRLAHQILDNAGGLHRITPGGGLDVNGNEDERPCLSLRRLLHLDELGIELVDEDWDRGKTKLTARFTARHGYTSAKNSTEQMLSKLAHSTVQGHTHRLSLRYRTEHDDEDEDQPTSTRMAAEAGCMAKIADGLGYTNDPDWQQGALLIHAFADDDFHVAPLIYVPGRLLAPGGRRYTA